jgi:hypothetical protein
MLARRSSLALALSLLVACGGNQSEPKSPASSKAPPPASTAPGADTKGDAANPSAAPIDPAANARDPHEAALLTLLAAPWGARNDRDDTVHAPTPDWERWRRVRFFGLDHFTGFKYRKEHDVVAAVFIQDMPPGTPVKSETCMRRFEAWGRPQIKPFDVKFSPFSVKFTKWRNQPLMISSVDGALNVGLSRVEFSGAWAAFPAYPNACLIYAVGVPWQGHADLAKKLRDRWVEEGFVYMNPLTVERPYRKQK